VYLEVSEECRKQFWKWNDWYKGHALGCLIFSVRFLLEYVFHNNKLCKILPFSSA
jgi:hypothetical protein